MTDPDTVFDRIDTLLDLLEERDPAEQAQRASFALGLISDEHPSTHEVAALYLQWGLSGRDKERATLKCRCNSGWITGKDKGLSPCVKCRPEANEAWFRTVADSDQAPDG